MALELAPPRRGDDFPLARNLARRAEPCVGLLKLVAWLRAYPKMPAARKVTQAQAK